MNRRLFLTRSATGLAMGLWTTVARALPVSSATKGRIKAVAFDAFAIFDPRPVFALAEKMFPGTSLSDEWRTRQFEYTWLRVFGYPTYWVNRQRAPNEEMGALPDGSGETLSDLVAFLT